MKPALLVSLLVGCATAKPAPVQPIVVAPKPAEEKAPSLRPLPTVAPMTLVVLPTASTPIVSVRLVFRVGSVDDPKGREGLTALTTRLLVEGGTKALSAAELNEALFPMAAELDADTDKEFTVVSGRVHRERLERFLEILGDVVLSPRLEPKEFERLRSEQLNLVRNRLRSENDEELGKVMLDALLYAGHPYGHAVVGTESGLSAATLDDATAHWRAMFTQERLVIGLAGAVDDALGARLKARLSALPAAGAPVVTVPPAPAVKGQTLIIRRDTASTAGSFGLSWPLRRSDPDFPLVFLGLSYLGEHRQEHGVLFRELRDRRGLNYGTYAYAEHYRQDGWHSIPRPNIVRSVQDFSLWLRPVEAKNGLFATRGVLSLLTRTLDEPLPPERFETSRGFLIGTTRLWTLTDQRRLGWAIDELLAGSPGHLERVRTVAASATPEQVQAALKRHLDRAGLNFVFVTKDAEGLKAGLVSGAPSPVSYSAPKPPEVLAEDKAIERHPLPMTNDSVRIVEASEVMR